MLIVHEPQAAAESLVLNSHSDTFNVCALRPSPLFGPGDDLVIPRIHSCIARGETPFVIGSDLLSGISLTLAMLQMLISSQLRTSFHPKLPPGKLSSFRTMSRYRFATFAWPFGPSLDIYPGTRSAYHLHLPWSLDILPTSLLGPPVFPSRGVTGPSRNTAV